MSNERISGRVKWFDAGRGYGFIKREGGPDVYVNIREVREAGLDDLQANQAITFTVRRTPQGLRAQEIALPGGEPAGGSELSTTRTSFTLDAGYLGEGYFEDEEKQYLRPEVLDSLAIDVAKVLGTANPAMSMHQLRRFFHKARAIEAKLDREADFRAVKPDIVSFKRDVAHQVGRGLVPAEFQAFINCNVALAMEDKTSFSRGFLPHFESVLAYFVYFFQE
jgi:CspA family cold shock protein